MEFEVINTSEPITIKLSGPTVLIVQGKNAEDIVAFDIDHLDLIIAALTKLKSNTRHAIVP